MTGPVSPSGNAGVPDDGKTAASVRILLVDDDPVNRMVALGLLRRHGWEAVGAEHGKAALQILAGERFNLILMDLQMPEMDGFQTATAIREREAQGTRPVGPREIQAAAAGSPGGGRSAHIPIVALTTASQPGVREKCLAAGMDDYLTKPINPAALYACVEKHLSPQATA